MHFRAAKKANGVEYYQYCVCYVDDILVCGEDPRAQMDEISGKFTLKDGTVEEPKMYLGANIVKTEVVDDSGNKFPCWSISSSNYTTKATNPSNPPTTPFNSYKSIPVQ